MRFIKAALAAPLAASPLLAAAGRNAPAEPERWRCGLFPLLVGGRRRRRHAALSRGIGPGMNVNIVIDTHSNNYLENLKLAVLDGQARYSLIAGSGPILLQRPSMWNAIKRATKALADELRREDIVRIAPRAGAGSTR